MLSFWYRSDNIRIQQSFIIEGLLSIGTLIGTFIINCYSLFQQVYYLENLLCVKFVYYMEDLIFGLKSWENPIECKI